MTTALLLLLAVSMAISIVEAAPGLRASRNLNPKDINLCFCEGCSVPTLSTNANDHSCGERIQWVLSNKIVSEADACRRVAQDEFPEECGACDPDACQVQSFCGVSTCTMDVLDTPACDNGLGGCHSCGERIRYLVESDDILPIEACAKVALEQFPEECGRCSSSSPSLTMTPTSSPSATSSSIPSRAPTLAPTTSALNTPSLSPSLEPTTVSGYVPTDTIQNPCGVATCTPEVMDTMACNDFFGGCHTCGSRITYLIEEESYHPEDACEIVGYSQFMSQCGGCIPSHLRTPVVPVNASKLVWSDEFDYDGLPDPSKWTYDIGKGDWGWGNNELQHYTDRIDNAFVTDGILNVRALREDYKGSGYTSARLKTEFRGDWTYGRIQVRARLSNGGARGTWAAAWMLPTDWVHGGWPDSGEIDIMEHVGYDPGIFHGTVHTDSFNHMKGTQSGGAAPAELDGWHIYEIDWTPNKIDFIMDNFRFHSFAREEPSTFREWPFDQRFHIILNLAVGGSWGGVKGVDASAFEGVGQVMEVDWVRVYSN